MLAVTLSPMQNGAQDDLVCLLTVTIQTTVVRIRVRTSSARVARPRSVVPG